MRRLISVVALGLWLGCAGSALAQDEEESTEGAAAPDEEATAGEAASESGEPERAAEPAAASGKPVWWIGPYVSLGVVPSFLLNVVLDASPTFANVSAGATVTHRNADGFSWVLGLGYLNLAAEGPFRASGDPEVDTEYLESSLGIVHLRGELLWSLDITDQLAFEYGVGLDVGVTVGELERSEAYRDGSGEFRRCAGPGNPLTTNALGTPYCEPTVSGLITDRYDAEGAHYGVVDERVPPILLGVKLPTVGLRFTPIRELAIKLEASFGLYQFAFGLSAAYGLDA